MAPAAEPRTIAVLGAGRVGTAIARTLLDAEYRVLIATSGDPSRIEAISRIVVPGAEPRWAGEAVAEADIVVLSIPLHRVSGLDPELFAGSVVIDGMNYWPPVDGVIPEFEHAPRGTSAAVQSLLPGAHVVKTFNHTGYHDLEPDRRGEGDPDRLALAVAGDDPAAVGVVAGIVERIGYDAVMLDDLEEGVVLQPGGDVFGSRLDAAGMTTVLDVWRSKPAVA